MLWFRQNKPILSSTAPQAVSREFPVDQFSHACFLCKLVQPALDRVVCEVFEGLDDAVCTQRREYVVIRLERSFVVKTFEIIKPAWKVGVDVRTWEFTVQLVDIVRVCCVT